MPQRKVHDAHATARLPELERDPSRRCDLGYEPAEAAGFLRYLEHGYPTPLARWHYHDELELHLITASSGRVFVGDYIGYFEPGHLVLTGPRLPHNWISADTPQEGYRLRDKVLQFSQAPLIESSKLMPELTEVLPLISRASYGIEFYGISRKAADYFARIKNTHGILRLAAFYEFIALLAHCQDYRLLSSVQFESQEDDDSLDRINGLVSEITDNIEHNFSLRQIAKRFNMSESAFSRYFRKATGNTFTDFVNHIRISKACHLLMETDAYINNICYDVGFNNLANFNRRFLQLKGVTPKEYRQRALSRF